MLSFAVDELRTITMQHKTTNWHQLVLLAILCLTPGLALAADAANYGFWSVVPPLFAIVLALVVRQVLPALFGAIWVGGWIAADFSFSGILTGLLDAFQVYVLNALADADHAAVILFSFMIGGLVGIISRNGGMLGVVHHISRWATDARHAASATATMGLAIFFDDYANTLVVGNTMRPVTDKFGVSREKLAYIVDSTAAPVSCLAFITTWIGYELGLIDDAVKQIPGFTESAYSVFLNSLAYSFYPIFAIVFVYMIALTRRDFGPMWKAENVPHEKRQTADVSMDPEIEADEEKPQRAINAVIPLLTLIISVMVGLWYTGEGDTLQDIIGSANAFKALMWGSLVAVLVAVILTLSQGLATLGETMEAWTVGVRGMLPAMIILVLAWSLSGVTKELGTASYLVSVLGDQLPLAIVPALVFVMAAATAFATGTSWGTMGILMPLVIPLVAAVVIANGGDVSGSAVLYSSVACVLAGAVWGDHCSPISDTTILSSMASGCDHIEHVRTQLPYALAVASVSILIGTIPTAMGLPWWVSMIAGVAVLWAIIRIFGRPPVAATTQS